MSLITHDQAEQLKKLSPIPLEPFKRYIISDRSEGFLITPVKDGAFVFTADEAPKIMNPDYMTPEQLKACRDAIDETLEYLQSRKSRRTE